MAVHIAPPAVFVDGGSPLFVPPSAARFGTVYGTFAVDPGLPSGPTALTIAQTSILGTYSVIIWGSGGSGGGSVAGNPAGDMIGGAGGAGMAYAVNIQITAPLAVTCSIVITAGSVSLIDTRATRAPGVFATATKTITAIAGRGGTAATYSVGYHSAGTGGAGGGQSTTPITITTTADSNAFINSPPAQFTGWGFTSGGMSIAVTPWVGAKGVDGIRGAVASPAPTFTQPINPDPTVTPIALVATTPGNVGISAGAGGAGCGSTAVLTPGNSGTAFAIVIASSI